MTDDELNRFLAAIEQGLDQERKIQMPIDLAGKRYYAQHTAGWVLPAEIAEALIAADKMEYVRGFAESRNADLITIENGELVLLFRSSS